MLGSWFAGIAMLGLLFSTSASLAADGAKTTKQTCEQLLVESLSAQGEWTSVHAAEYLIHLNQPEQTVASFRPQADTAQPPFRIGVWRVLAQAEPSQETRTAYVERIRSVLLNKDATDRLHALETLAKLAVPIASDEELKIVQQMSEPEAPGCSFALWRLIQRDSSTESLAALADQLSSVDPVARLRAGFVLSQLGDLPMDVQSQVENAIHDEPQDSIAYPYVASAAGTEQIRKLLHSQDPNHQALALKELAARSITFDYPLPKVVDSESPLSLRQAAAFAWLKQNTSPKSHAVDSARN
ncbi:hypothetical protein [Blastopirellula marina]|uniref:HEAT repeat domain-containing protein n=1 Tax=Blastopirellula marina TaxID=124 RepID=A0A2S8GCV6_9BACT|nr:hypothetical protein [Blastopirellula marina]PQO42305.1 hypothetical protein C5Y93_28610 [Blastopirellula marina]